MHITTVLTSVLEPAYLGLVLVFLFALLYSSYIQYFYVLVRFSCYIFLCFCFPFSS